MFAVTIPRPGPEDVLEMREVPRPVPGPGEVLVRVKATALNRADLLQRAGHYPAPPGAPAEIPGLEMAGEIAASGQGATRWREGERVFGIVGGGAHAEFVVTHQDAVARVPERLDWMQAAAVPEVFITAHDALRQAAMRPGETVLIHAVGSGVGLAAVQVVRALGGTAVGTARQRSKIAAAEGVGLARGLVVDDPGDLVEPVREWTSGRGVDVVLDLVGGDYFAASIRACALHGRVILIGTLAGAQATVPLSTVLRQRLTLKGTVLRSRPIAEKIEATAAFEREIVPLLADGTLRPVIDAVLPIGEIRAAHRRLASNAGAGKIVLTM